MAAGAIRALKEHGVEEPTRFVSGFGDNQFLRAVTGGIATVHFGAKTMGKTAADMMLDLMETGSNKVDGPRHIQLGHVIKK